MQRRGLIASISVAVILVAGLTADLLAENRAESRIEDRLACLDADYDIEGFPVLLQLARGTVGRLRVDVPELTVRDREVSAEVTLRDIPVDAPKTAGAMEVEATLDWDQVQDVVRAKLPERFASATVTENDGLIAIDTGVSTLLGEVPATLLAEVAVEDEQVLVRPAFVELGGRRISTDLLGRRQRFAQLLEPRSFTPRVPDGLSLTAAGVARDGLTATVSGTDVDLDALRDGAGTGTGCGSSAASGQ
ncbi:DUF2993 domain-containing protein [Nocardioides sp.]|uniref:LmeA family phospholipid-binding protein n=1 Tax=Nocardioides sp. TaxID=35761 RepID=UPI001A2A269B|nr:DUF2993 domain-containing protein [Nocardioides sp.]MBJ7355922.1 DUF2993 domain-containing protein [Nocardioides sp.]